MVFVAEAFAGWLFGQLAEVGRKRLGAWLLGSDQQRALQQASTAAIWATARQLRATPAATDDVQSPDHLARVIDHVFQEPPDPAESLAEQATLLQGLQAGVAARLAVLGNAEITGTGESSASLLGVSVPALTDLLVSQLLRELVTGGASGGPLAPLTDQLNHDLTHLQGQQHSASLARLTTDLQAALAALDQQVGLIPARATSLGYPVHQLTDPFALEVHRAIDAPGGTAPLPILPAYIERAHDRQLQAIVQQATDGRSAITVLVGGSSTGKTRACWEAVQGLPHGWRLWHPIDPSRPEAAAEALPAVRPRTVIWLNEAQHYLLTPTSDLGERVAAGLRELLRDPERGPVLVLGTIWPEFWATLTAPPAPDGQHEDAHAQARALLTGTDIAVPEAFTEATLRAVKAATKTDPRLAEAAARAEDGRIAQFLAGAPALLERYRNAPVAAKALIEAAMDARRLGHSHYLPHALLEAATPGYLTDQQWDALGEDWLEQALAYCAASCRGARGPLTRVRPRPGQPSPAQPCYRLADYLEETGRALRGTILAPAALWDALEQYADERNLLQIASEAYERSLYRHAFRLYQRSAEAGDFHAVERAAGLLERIGRPDEAIEWYQRIAEANNPYAMQQTADLLERLGRFDEAIEWYQRIAEANNPYAMQQTADLLEELGRLDEAIEWYQRIAEANNPYAMQQTADLLERLGRFDEAINWSQRAAEAGYPGALRQATRLLEQAGSRDEAIDWLLIRVEAGDRGALRRAVRLLVEADRLDEAVDWLLTRARASDRDVLRWAAWRLDRAGRLDEAIDGLLTRAAEAGNPVALAWVAGLLKRAGRLDEAIDWYRRASESGHRDALRRTAELLEQVGRLDEAIDWLLTRAADVGDSYALGRAAGLLKRAGGLDEAIDGLLTRAAEADNHLAMGGAAALLMVAGRLDEAIDWYQRAAEAGDRGARRRAAELLEQLDRLDEAIDWYQRAAEAGDRGARRRAAELLEQLDRLDEAIDWYQRAAEAGDRGARRRAAELLEQLDRLDEAIDWLQARHEAGDFYALEQAIDLLLEQAGRLDEAIDWLQARVEASDPLPPGQRVSIYYAHTLEATGRHEEATALYQRAAKAGYTYSQWTATALLERAGRDEEAIALYQRAAETGDPYALRPMAALAERAGRHEEAIALYQRAAEAGDPQALQQAARLLERADRVVEAAMLSHYGLEPGGHIASEWNPKWPVSPLEEAALLAQYGYEI